METEYLKKCFGNCLAQALAEVAKVQPSDPIEYLAHWLYHHGKTTRAQENWQKKNQLKEEHASSHKEKEMTEIPKEEQQVQQKCTLCHQELISKTLSSYKNVFMQKDMKLLEEEALKQDSQRGTPSVIPEMPQQAPPSRPARHIGWNLETP
ncbi:DPY30 domain-containing protein 2 [Otolemur garnettii]|uniref:DPY30 domain-containing protein 2 n=1 Tax=Otolemur garnettii TaxID=30611 RepID=UPI0006442DC5|nr:DPY30 domain-containing protein 2 [Otolemur garnettii]